LLLLVGCSFLYIGIKKDNKMLDEAEDGMDMSWWMSSFGFVSKIGGREGLQAYFILIGILCIIGVISLAVKALTY